MANSSLGRASRTEVAFWCIFYATGVIVFLVLQGLDQERIMTVPYGGKLFPYEECLTMTSRIFTVLCAALLMVINGEHFVCLAPVWAYGIAALSNVISSVCRLESLKYITFPVLMIGKSFKMLPVMAWGWLISGKTYSVQDCLLAMLITGGAAAFALTGPVQATRDTHEGHSSTAVGYLLVLLDLAIDNFTSAYEDHLFSKYGMSRFNQMFFINGFGFLFALIWSIFSGGLVYALTFSMEHPQFLLDIGTLSIWTASSQVFIFSQVKEFGAVVFAATGNVRQVVSTVVSYLTYGHYITHLQLLSLVLVFAPLFYRSSTALLDEQSEKMPLLQVSEEKGPDVDVVA